MWQFWLIVSGICFVLEMATVGFLVFWFGIGALFALITSLITDNIIIQTTVFILSSTLLLFLTKPFVKKLTNKDKIQTNAYSIIGKTGIVTREINSKKGIGQIKVESEIWSAKTEVDNDIIIPEGTEVEIIELDGVKAVVKKISENTTATVSE